MRFHAFLYDLGDLKVTDLPIKKQRHRALICRIEHCRQRTAFPAGAVSQLQTIESLHIRPLKSNL